ncbi:MAG: DUF3320 domain-containing protein [Flavobacteriales bacterium]|jgi:hypothetical protein|nr:DUF3320 domain-containing protein [Flavobacteriales bacterium]
MEYVQSSKFTVDFQYIEKVNFAIVQNKIELIQKFTLENTENEPHENILIRLESSGNLFSAIELSIPKLSPEIPVEVSLPPISLNKETLVSLTEKTEEEMRLEIFIGDRRWIRRDYPIEVLPYDYWSGAHIFPEIIAAFVTPNHPAIIQVQRRTAQIIKEWTKNPSLDGYQQKNKNHVKQQIAAVFQALQELKITYVNPPISFEWQGQRIRTADQIFEHKMGTCLDTSILFSSCLEAIGLYPILIFKKGHAYLGVWLSDTLFPDAVNDDSSLIENRIADGIHEILLLETTTLTDGNQQAFEEAIEIAKDTFKKEAEFEYFVDIKRARLAGIRPIAQRILSDKGYQLVLPEKEEDFDSLYHEAPEKLEIHNLDSLQKTTFSRQDLWERKLLDLSLRNNLLNIRATRSVLQLLTVDIDTIEDGFADGKEYTLFPKPEEWIPPMDTKGIFPALGKRESIHSLLQKEQEINRIRTYQSPKELEKSILFLYRKAKVSLEENGANTLFMTIGALRWYETENSEQARFAPLLLVPVEMVRKSAKAGYIVRTREEDTMMNITLLEMLRYDFDIDIHGLEELPKDESGIDVKKVFSIIRQGILDQKRWQVEEVNFLGTFSFNKFMLWNDIHHHAQKLTQNKVVDSLVKNQLQWKPNQEILSLDYNAKKAQELLLPIPADASQLEAIYAATHGESFILHGPPGTGKSQTITNMIANALYQGKKVLFVAEKMAALSVVEKRLENIGLAPFCLELHSDKVKKSAVLQQLKETTEVVKKTSPEEFKTQVEKLAELKFDLQAYQQALHQKHPIGFSLFQAFSEALSLKNVLERIPFTSDFLKNKTEKNYDEWIEIIEEIQTIGKQTGHPADHSLFGIHKIAPDISKTTWEQMLSSIENDAKALSEKIKILNNLFEGNWTKDSLDNFMIFAQNIPQISTFPNAISDCFSDHKTLDKLSELLPYGKKSQKIARELLSEFCIESGLELPADQLLSRWKIAQNKWFLPRWFAQRKITKEIKPFLTREKETDAFLEKLLLFQQENKKIKDEKSFLAKTLDFWWEQRETNWEQISEAINQTSIFKDQIESWIHQYKIDRNFIEKITEIISNKSVLWEGKNAQFFEVLNELYQQYQQNLSAFTTLCSLDKNWVKQQTNWLDHLVESTTLWKEDFSETRLWNQWLKIREKAINQELQLLISHYESGVPTQDLHWVFQKSIHYLLIELIPKNHEALASFNGDLYENKIRKYQEITRYLQQLSIAELQAKLASNIPHFEEGITNSSEMGILQKAIRSRGRGISIRRLFDRIPNLLPRINPCMLMSPLSVAKYLKADEQLFDLVIFDEASQLPTCDAIGTMARGQNVVVVGDPKQMPPTSFFSSNRYDENLNDIEDLESILDDCSALSMPSKKLRWHYRSKHESLIAFSNAHYYEYSLQTFPSPDDLNIKVKHMPVDGFYDKGKTRQNRAEAEAIVQYILDRYAASSLPDRSIGVVTFSMTQQNLIEDLLQDALKNHPELETKIWNNEEPLFIKNLENVQGDERDIILFSIGYAPDKNGKLSLNFGPLNREGGWRRLNVAVSRSRYEMVVFSTLKSEEINLKRTKSKGIAGIKAFLEYAEKGKFALTSNRIKKDTSGNDFLLEDIAVKLENLGYKIKTNIGYSDFKIDLAVMHPQKTDTYILGIQTDGPNFFKTPSARDRNFTQPTVLQLLDWNIYRIWSTDWWLYSDKIVTDLGILLQDLIENPEKDLNKTDPSTAFSITQKTVEEPKNAVYKATDLRVGHLSSDDFYLKKNESKIVNQLEKILHQEAPICHSLLHRRLLNAYDLRLTAKMERFLHDICKKQNWITTQESEEIIYWKNFQDPALYKGFRTAESTNDLRAPEQIPLVEIEQVILHILQQQMSLPTEELIKNSAQIIGFRRLTSKVKPVFQKGLDSLLQKNQIFENDGRVFGR